MALQFRSTVRDGELDAIETVGGTTCAFRLYTGSVPSDVTQANTGTLLVDFNLPSDWMAAASSGSKAKAGTWSGTASGGAASTPGYFRIYNNQTTKDGTTCVIQGTAGIGSGDMSFDGTVTSGQTVTVSTFTLTAANS